MKSSSGRRWEVEPRTGNWITQGAWLQADKPEGKLVTVWFLRTEPGGLNVDTLMVSAIDAIEVAEKHLHVFEEDRVQEHKDLSALCLEHLRPPNYSGGSWTLNPDALAEAIMQAGWKRA